ncbi:FtsK/SpoIIIE domain-containing protein [Fusibacter bizertensis]
MLIKEQIEILNAKFEKLHRDFERLEVEKNNLGQKYMQLTSSVKSKYQSDCDIQMALKEEVLKYFRIAEDNSNKKFNPAGRIPVIPDIAKLNQLIEKIDINNRNDYVAGQIVDLAEHYVAYIDMKIKELTSFENNALKDLANRKEKEMQNLVNQKKQVLLDCEKYLQGPDLKKMVSLFEVIQDAYEITGNYFGSWGSPLKRKRMMLLGYYKYVVDVPQILCVNLKQTLGKYFDSDNTSIASPFGYTTDSHEKIFIEYLEQNEIRVKSGVQALILNYMRYFEPTEYKISIFDYIHYNADVLGALSVFTHVKNGIVDAVSTDTKTLKQNIAILANYYRQVESKIGHEPIYRYNKQCASHERIPFRIMIINRKDEATKISEDPEMEYMLNNAEKFGIMVIYMRKSMDGGSKGKSRENQYLAKSQDTIRIISGSDGTFYVENNIEWSVFNWLDSPSHLPDDFVDKVLGAIKPIQTGTKYFSRYAMTTPVRSKDKRKAVTIPFAIDENDQVISCNFENELFAAYMMGASRSGKSTLLHTIISGLAMNYHPDELELWLLDFKMLEFKRYVNHSLPHVKYLLLEKSSDLVFDIVDQMTKELEDRQYIFSQNGWSKITEVPLDVYMPIIFVIIDEFAQMSQILKETKGEGYGADYTIKLENLLAKGAALGFKFIFASQTYTTGISGLTETACKQIQLRFALKNTHDEIKQTLMLSSDEITPELSRSIYTLPAYETLFKWRNENGDIKLGRFHNLYTESDEIDALVELINAQLNVSNTDRLSNSCYRNKHSILIDGSQPKSFSSQIGFYKKYESELNGIDFDEEGVPIYSGVPCSFNVARPFFLCHGTAENMLLAGGGRENSISVILSVINSYARLNKNIEIWSHERDSIYKKYKDTVLNKREKRHDLIEICNQIVQIKENIQNRIDDNKLIICFGYEKMYSDFEILGNGTTPQRKERPAKANATLALPDLSEVIRKASECTDPSESRKIMDSYNAQLRLQNDQNSVDTIEDSTIEELYDARNDFDWIIKRASNHGVHFLLCFEQARDFTSTRLDEKIFRHKMLFAMNKEDSLTILGNRKANALEQNAYVYSDGRMTLTMRPHIYKGVPNNGWVIDENNQIVQRR